MKCVRLFQKKTLMVILLIGAIGFWPVVSQAKGGGDEQDRIILLNDSAAALEESNPQLSKSLTQFADEKEKEWEANKANKSESPIPVKDQNIPQLQERIKLLKAAAIAIEPAYPLIAKSLNKMAKEMNKVVENDK